MIHAVIDRNMLFGTWLYMKKKRVLQEKIKNKGQWIQSPNEVE